MLAADLVWFVLRWGLIGGIAVTVYLVGVWQLGFIPSVRNESGGSPRAVLVAAVVTGAGSLLLYTVLLVMADVRDLLEGGIDLPFARLYALNFLVYLFWLFYDTFVIDILLVSVWHPAFLRLPEQQAHGSVAYHLRTIPRGLILGAFVSGVATSISWLFFR